MHDMYVMIYHLMWKDKPIFFFFCINKMHIFLIISEFSNVFNKFIIVYYLFVICFIDDFYLLISSLFVISCNLWPFSVLLFLIIVINCLLSFFFFLFHLILFFFVRLLFCIILFLYDRRIKVLIYIEFFFSFYLLLLPLLQWLKCLCINFMLMKLCGFSIFYKYKCLYTRFDRQLQRSFSNGSLFG